ncbi:MAG: rhodanese-like domain-containing protein [Chromatiaceae bacterium]|nr:rhodanese-like domain-containing protein [Gammaproteobacteria bacterium]MCP5428081.1 rhodanese-like domain-containing protein [Chromatiaceae bacterium]MCB1860345.1 rhodanese-like domain-containing protein [Gammaproteobacteria bacterium]MCB1870415.1 rhodanese-like domain-containing protein [Gammaproteobacteria bacterium]MCB1878687.1 rhodanese-like domain-containing protein [Gammaproteobacteria bacterium]
MEQLLEFIANHPFLFAALGLVTALLVHNLITGMDKSLIHPHQATAKINQEDAVVVDVRPMADFSNGHIINSINIPMNGLKNQINRLEKYRNKPIIVACRSGAQSSGACKQLHKEGFEQVFNLKGGILAWQDANLPVSRKK